MLIAYRKGNKGPRRPRTNIFMNVNGNDRHQPVVPADQNDTSGKKIKAKIKKYSNRTNKSLERKRKVEAKKSKKARSHRLDDPACRVPNDIYFGDVQVPLHVLHSYDNHEFDVSSSPSTSSSESESDSVSSSEKTPPRKR